MCRINISTVHEPKWQQQIIKLSMQLKLLMEHCRENEFILRSVKEQLFGVRATTWTNDTLLNLFLNTLPVMQ